jgi:hypothetical protein
VAGERHEREQAGAEGKVTMRLPRSQHVPGVQQACDGVGGKVEPRRPGRRAERNLGRAEHEEVGLSFAVISQNALSANDQVALFGDMFALPVVGIFGILKLLRANACPFGVSRSSPRDRALDRPCEFGSCR